MLASFCSTLAILLVLALQVVFVQSDCIDLLNPSTGVSDCPDRVQYCTNSVYLSLMHEQCPCTCGFCSPCLTTTTEAAEDSSEEDDDDDDDCVDLLNPSTGTSDCPNVVYLCQNDAYKTLMQTQCPATCGYC